MYPFDPSSTDKDVPIHHRYQNHSFNFEEWVHLNGLREIKHQLIKHNMTRISSLNTHSTQFTSFICDPISQTQPHPMSILFEAMIKLQTSTISSTENDKENNNNMNANHNQSKRESETRFIHNMTDNYLTRLNIYLVDIISWNRFDENLFSDGKSYLFCLPWDTSILWIPQWMDRKTGNDLKCTILSEISFEKSTLQYYLKNKRDKLISVKWKQRNRDTAWVSNYIPHKTNAIPLQKWSECLIKHATKTAAHKFNVMFMIHYKNGNNHIALHSDDEYGLGADAVIGSLSLGATRTFYIQSKEKLERGKRIEFKIPLVHGSFVLMNAGFQKKWKHSVPKEREVMGDRVNVTFRKYEFEKEMIKGELIGSDTQQNGECEWGKGSGRKGCLCNGCH